MWNLIYFQSITYLLYFFSLCALFLKKKPTLFLRLAPRLRARPMRLAYSASLSFVQCLNRRVSTATSDLNLLESMSFDTVSFEELLGHCNEIYKKNESDVVELEERLSAFGYVAGLEIDEPEEDMNDSQPNTSLDLKNTMEDDDSLYPKIQFRS
ncbi:hypothetical protein Hanom_Chr11g01051811 [Helianthus anomalus]